MSLELTDALRATIDSKAIAHLTTLDPDGFPQASAVWIGRDGDTIVLNTAEGRRKWRNMKSDNRVAISISPEDEAYENFSIQGRVIEMRTSDGVEVIDALAKKYIDKDTYPWLKPGMVRVTVLVEPVRIASY